jgi:hypothetical protein
MIFLIHDPCGAFRETRAVAQRTRVLRLAIDRPNGVTRENAVHDNEPRNVTTL